MAGMGEGEAAARPQALIPGVISHSTNVVEHPELVAERSMRLARLVGRENVMAGTDCGFAQAPVRAARASLDHVGEARGAGRRRAARIARIVGPEGRLNGDVPQSPGIAR